MGILEEAKELVEGSRNSDYGDVRQSFDRISGLWSAYLGATVSPEDVAKMMILLKVSRAKNNNHRDSLIDIAGYVDCLDKYTSPPVSSPGWGGSGPGGGGYVYITGENSNE